jgi:putative peptidoglycan lipid II flippase
VKGPVASTGIAREGATATLGAFVALGAGLLLDLSLAFLLGAGAETDALFVALRVPLGVAVFFPPTAVQVLIPLMSRWLGQGGDRHTANAQTTAALLATFILTGALAVVGALAAPAVVAVLAPGLDAPTQRLAADLARVVFFFIPTIAASEVLRAYRHAHRTHGVASALHGVVGVTIVAILFAFGNRTQVSTVAWAYVVGGVAQLILALLMARASGFRFVLGRIFSPQTRALGGLAARPIAASALQLGTRLVEQMIASFLAPGSITILAFANRLTSAVGGTLFFRPVATAFLGPMSALQASGDKEGTRSMLREGVRIMLLVSATLTALVVVAGPTFVAGLFSMGDLTSDQARLLGIVVAFYAASFPGAALQRILLGAAFARLDTGTYLRNTLYGAVVNLALLGIMAASWRLPTALLMVPIAYGLAQIVNVWHAARVVRRDVGAPFTGLASTVGKLGLVVALGVLVMFPVRAWLVPELEGSPLRLVGSGLAVAAVGLVAFLAGAFLVAPQFLRGLAKREHSQDVKASI